MQHPQGRLGHHASALSEEYSPFRRKILSKASAARLEGCLGRRFLRGIMANTKGKVALLSTITKIRFAVWVLFCK